MRLMFGPRYCRGLNHARCDTGFGWAGFFMRDGCCNHLVVWYQVLIFDDMALMGKKGKKKCLSLSVTNRVIASSVKQKTRIPYEHKRYAAGCKIGMPIFFSDGRPCCLLYVKPLHARPRFLLAYSSPLRRPQTVSDCTARMSPAEGIGVDQAGTLPRRSPRFPHAVVRHPFSNVVRVQTETQTNN